MEHNPFGDLNIDPIIGTQILGILGIHPEDYRGRPQVFAQVLDVVSFYKQYSNGVSILEKVALKAPPDQRLDRAYHYASLQRRKQDLSKELEGVTKEISILE